MCRMHAGFIRVPAAGLQKAASPPLRAYPKGFSLIEALIVMAVAAIGLAVGVPSYQGMTERTRISVSVR